MVWWGERKCRASWMETKTRTRNPGKVQTQGGRVQRGGAKRGHPEPRRKSWQKSSEGTARRKPTACQRAAWRVGKAIKHQWQMEIRASEAKCLQDTWNPGLPGGGWASSSRPRAGGAACRRENKGSSNEEKAAQSWGRGGRANRRVLYLKF